MPSTRSATASRLHRAVNATENPVRSIYAQHVAKKQKRQMRYRFCDSACHRADISGALSRLRHGTATLPARLSERLQSSVISTYMDITALKEFFIADTGLYADCTAHIEYFTVGDGHTHFATSIEDARLVSMILCRGIGASKSALQLGMTCRGRLTTFASAKCWDRSSSKGTARYAQPLGIGSDVSEIQKIIQRR